MLIKVIKFTIKFKIFDFYYPHIPYCNFKNSVYEKMWCCLTSVCVYRYIDDVLLINNPDFENYMGKNIPLSLRSKTRLRATTLLPTWIYSYRSRVTVSCALPFTINVTISTSISQTFRSWVAIFHLRRSMVFLSHSSYGMLGLAPLMNVLF